MAVFYPNSHGNNVSHNGTALFFNESGDQCGS